MPVTLVLCEATPSDFHTSTLVTSKSRAELFVSSAQAEANKQGRTKPSSTQQPTYSERLLRLELDTPPGPKEIHVRSGGLVHVLEAAYSNHRHLVLRPDDVWCAILAQFSLYVDAHAEELRSSFVSHQGQERCVAIVCGYLCDAQCSDQHHSTQLSLEIVAGGTIDTADFGWMSDEMGRLLGRNLKDPTLREWIIPNFSTTTPLDVTTASIIMMATLKAYFKYVFKLRCGIPRVTLLGTREDWVALRERVERLDQFGAEPTKWAALLRPVCDNFIACFDADGDATVQASCVDFWSRVCHRTPQRSGPSYLCGWATVFCVWREDGTWQGDTGESHHIAGRIPDLTAWPVVDANNVTKSVAEVPVLVDDNGTLYNTVLLAGIPGFCVTSGSESRLTPMVGWAMYNIER